MTTEQRLAEGIAASLAALGIPIEPGEVQLVRPARTEHGDWSTNVALVVAKAAGRSPREIAEDLAEALRDAALEDVLEVEVAGPGFVNFRLDTVLAAPGARRGRSRGRGALRHARARSTASWSRSSSCPPTRPAHSTWATAGSAPTATPSAAS